MRKTIRLLSLFLTFLLIFSVLQPCVLAESEGTTALITGDISLGDVNSDGKITSADARMILRYSAQLPVDEGFVAQAADIDQNGKITAADARLVLRFYAKLTLDIYGTPVPTSAAPTTTKSPQEYKIAMLGDSLVATIGGFYVTDRIDFFGRVSLNVYDIFKKKAQGRQLPIIDEVRGNNYDIAIVLLGINEVSYSDGPWIEQYAKIIKTIKQNSPLTKIYIHAILPISNSAERSSQFGCTNSGILNKNSLLRQLATTENVGFIDAGEIFRNSEGVLPEDAASDGIHLNKSYCVRWSNWLLEQVCK